MSSRDGTEPTQAGVLPERERFVEAVVRTISAARRDDEPVCVACLGVRGEPTGEHLAAIAAALSRSIRGGDVVARLDGDHFGLLLHHCELEILDIIARRLGAQVPAPLTGSLGIAYFSDPPQGEEHAAAEEALRTAREALTEAMAEGAPRVVVRTR